MKYLALLRAINVGGNSIIKMADLKKAFEDCGVLNVSTYIQSGNVLFESDEKNILKLREELERDLTKTFGYPIRMVLLSQQQVKNAVSDVPRDWQTRDDLRKYMAFIREPVRAQDIAPQVQVKEGVDFLYAGDNVLYLSTLLSGLTKSGFTKMLGKPFYKDLTIRNYTTVLKLLALLEK